MKNVTVVMVAATALACSQVAAIEIIYEQSQDNALVSDYAGTQDTYLSAVYPDSDLGWREYASEEELDLYIGSVRTDDGYSRSRSIMRWDLRFLARRYSSIESITLQLTMVGSTAPGTFSVYQIDLANAR